MKTETVIAEYESEAKARGHEQHRATISGASCEPRVMKRAIHQAERWGLPADVIEVIEVTDRGGPDECHDQRGNLAECIELIEHYLSAKWTGALASAGLPKSAIGRV